jgi:hypothetical protein
VAYRAFVQEAREFNLDSLNPKAHEHVYCWVQNASWEPEFNGRVLRKLTDLPGHPWRYELQPVSDFSYPSLSEPKSTLAKKDMQKMSKHYTDMWNHDPEV